MVACATSQADCDFLLFIVDAHRQVRRPDPRIPSLLASAQANLESLMYTNVTGIRMPPSVLALNKVRRLGAGGGRVVNRCGDP
jgi:GTP-binding protein Era